MTTTPKELVERLREAAWLISTGGALTVRGLPLEPGDLSRAAEALSRPQTVDREAIIRDCAELAFRCAAPIVITQTAYDDGARDAGNAILALLHPIDDISETGGGV